MTTAAEYRIEHVAETPSGFHVRTFAPGPRSDHLVRVAFPRGARRRGSGQLVEILHPPEENPCRFNPESHRILWLDTMIRKLEEDYRGWRRASMSKEEAIKQTLSHTVAGPAAIEEFRRRVAKENPGDATLFDAIGHGDKVTIVNRFGQKHTGRAVMRGPAGWVLNVGGRHGTPAIASPENVTKVRKTNPDQNFREELTEGSRKVVIWSQDNGLFHVWPFVNNGEDMVKSLGNYAKLETARSKARKWLSGGGRNPGAAAEKIEWARNELRRVLDYISAAKAVALLKGKAVVAKGKATTEKLEWARNELRRVLDHISASEAIKLIRGKNPDDGELADAESLYETFHGHEPREILEMQESSETRGEYTALGDLVELTMIAPTGDHVLVKFKSDGVRLASSPNGEQLYLLGGDQDIAESLGMFGADDAKDLIDLGEAKQIVYEASKWQTNFDPQEWKHDFGEESGVRPRGFYDQLKKRIFFAGGNYKVKRPGIVD